jgi:hypothetical protein
MKSKFRMLLSAITFFAGLALLFAGLALAGLSNSVPAVFGRHCEGSTHLSGYCSGPPGYGCNTFYNPKDCPVGAIVELPVTIPCCNPLACHNVHVDNGRYCSGEPNPTPTPTPTPVNS